MRSRFVALLCVGILFLIVWIGGRGVEGRDREEKTWTEVAPGVLRSPGPSFGYALVAGDRALLIDAPGSAAALQAAGIKTIDLVLLTHHHRDTAAEVEVHLANKVPVRAARIGEPWLTPAGIEKYWRESLPLRSSRTAYLVLPEVPAGIDCSLTDGTTLDWQDWSITVLATPGHSPDHLAFVARKGKKGPVQVFCGDALAGAGKLWSPYTTDWDHWTDLGLKPTEESLRKLAKLEPALLLPAHGPVISRTPSQALEQTAEAVKEVAFLKSYERYTRERRKDPPTYAFLAREQAGSNGSKPWSRLAKHLWLTGNTYVLASRDGPCLVVDPWEPHSARQIPKLQADEKLGKVEVVLCSHAHFDHYDGAYNLLERDQPEVWTLDRVAIPIAEPFLLRAPFLDARPLEVHRRVKDGATVAWREYQLKFHFLPGQSEYTMGVETTIDGKRCFFTADNFFHHDLYSGTGGWMGLNRSGPLLYADSAAKVLAARPDWVLGEHGSAMEFNAEDFRRRVEWGKVSARAVDALCVSGNHRRDWNPHRVHLEPLLHSTHAGATVQGTLVVHNPLPRQEQVRVVLEGRGRTDDQTWTVELNPGTEKRLPVKLPLAARIKPGRHILAVRVESEGGPDGSDAFIVLDVKP